jgi:thiamine-monophosphate kinase
MSRESDFIASLRSIASDPSARGLLDDAAVVPMGGIDLVLTQDMIVEGVHFLAADPPEDVAWKLLTVNLSDLAAKGAEPIGILLGYTLAEEPAWDRRFVAGMEHSLRHFGVSLLGGDTVASRAGSPRTLSLTAAGKIVSGGAPSRAGAKPGDIVWVTGSIGDAGAGLRAALGEIEGHPELIERYRRPQPRLEAGAALAPMVNAMTDVSDGLLIDAERIAAASGSAIAIDLDCVPISRDYLALSGDETKARMSAVTSGDDYELLFIASPDKSDRLFQLSRSIGLAFTPVGRVVAGQGLTLTDRGGPVKLPDRLGYEHC